MEPLRKEDLRVGQTHWGFLEQDWITSVLEEIHDDHVIVNYHGRLWCYGVPQFRESVPLYWFLKSNELAPDGHWSRQYEEPSFEMDTYYGG